MQPSHAVVGLGLVALVSGLISLYTVFTPAQEPVSPVPSPIPLSTGAESVQWAGVDRSITRVLVDMGLASVHRDRRDRGLPEEVTRTLAGLGVPLVIADPGPGS